ncbi:MAG TPA: DUF2461 domain-containing protein [Gemmatimonadaceae bacterium]|nr:DUF2461 domain-containing protein [Gemmatimonadaceae bacterium]
MSEFTGFTPRALTFLRQLQRNNQREWFQAHRDAYDHEILAPMRHFVEEMDVRFARFAPEFVGDPRRSIFRIHRDIRFSRDKSPYKTHAACWFSHRNASHGVGSETHGGGAGFYFHLEPRASITAGGIWMPPRPSLNRIREMLAERPESFERTLRGIPFRRRFDGLSEEAMLTRLPRGYAPGHRAEPWLRHCSFTVSAPLTDAQVTNAKLCDVVARDFALMLPLVRWLNSALGYRPAARR